MFKKLSTLTLLLTCQVVFAQSLEERISNEICEKLDVIDLSASYQQVNKTAIDLIQKAICKTKTGCVSRSLIECPMTPNSPKKGLYRLG